MRVSGEKPELVQKAPPRSRANAPISSGTATNLQGE